MCGRYSFVWLLNKLQDQFGPVKHKSDGITSYNIAPGQKNPVILEDKNQTQIIDFYSWGLIPHWAKDKPSIGFKTINARVETVAEKPMYKKNLLQTRCIVPASGFFEWKKSGATKTPFYIHPEKLPYFAFAGLYESWEKEDGQNINSYTIITREANEKMSKLHDRMPVMLKKKNYDKWLSKENSDQKKLSNILEDFENDISYYPISKEVNSPRNNYPGIIQQSQQTLF